MAGDTALYAPVLRKYYTGGEKESIECRISKNCREKTMKPMLIVQTTFEDETEAVAMAENVIRERLAGCAQLSGGIRSFFWWKDTIEQSQEYILSLKTTPQKYAALQSFIKRRHSYDTPEILAIEVDHVSTDYLRWLQEETETGESSKP